MGLAASMARVTHNLLLSGLSGKIGPLVVRQVGGQTVVQAAEAPGRRAPRSSAQQAHLARMYQAQLYAKAQLRDPEAKARYAIGIDQRRTSAYTVAIADFMNPPQVKALDASHYQGRPGDAVLVTATDDFAVATVHVRVFAPAGQLLAEGPATPQPDGRWRYEAPAAHPAGPGTCLEAEARDYAGHPALLALVL